MTLAALADGAGSARFSHFGAELVVQRVLRILPERFDAIFERNIAHKRFSNWLVSGLQWELAQLAKEGIEADDDDRVRLGLPSIEVAPSIPCELNDLACTLLDVAVKGDRYMAIHLGDGVIGCSVSASGGANRLRTLSGPSNGEFANETIFITSSNASASLKVMRGKLVSRHHVIDGFVLMSDGSESSLFHKRTYQLAPACAKLLDACRALSEDEMGEQLERTLCEQIARRTTDDCSVALLARGRRW